MKRYEAFVALSRQRAPMMRHSRSQSGLGGVVRQFLALYESYMRL
jgi:hypothetical protein